MTAASLRRLWVLAPALEPVHLVLLAVMPVGVVTHVPTVGKSLPPGSPLSLVASGVREPDPRCPRIINYFHLLEALELPLLLRMLVLGEEECFFTDVFVLAFVMLGRCFAPCSSTTATGLAATPPYPPGQSAAPSATVTWSRAERDLAGRSRAPAQQSRALGVYANSRRTVSPTLG